MLTNIIEFLFSIIFQFVVCLVTRCFLFKLFDNLTSIDAINIQTIPYSFTAPKNMSSSEQPSTQKEEDKTMISGSLHKERTATDPEEDTENDDVSVKSSYKLYIATSVAVLAAICSLLQSEAVNDFAIRFSTSLCNTSPLDSMAEGSKSTLDSNSLKANRTLPSFGVSSEFNPILKEGEEYDALAAIHSRYVNTYT